MRGFEALLPEPHTDFIYSVVAEELELFGALLTLLCFCVIAARRPRVDARPILSARSSRSG